MVAPAVECDVFVQRPKLSVDPRLREATSPERCQFLLELALAAPDDRSEHVDPDILRVQHHQVKDPFERL